MVYEHDTSDRVYSTVLTDRTLMKIRANELLRLVDGDSPFAELREKHIKDLSPEEKKAVHDFLKGEKVRLQVEKGDLVQRIRAGNITSESIDTDIKWYENEIERRERSMDYITKLPDFLN